MLDFSKQCRDIQEELRSTNQIKKAILQKRNGSDIDVEAEIDKENKVPACMLSRVITNNRSKQHSRNDIQRSILLPIKKRDRTIIATDIINQEELKKLSGSPSRTQNLSTIVKQERIDNQKISLRDRYSVMTPKTNHDKSAIVWIPLDMSQPNELNALWELKASCDDSPSLGDQAGSKSSIPTSPTESSLIVANVDCAKFSSALTKKNTKSTITLLVSQSNELIIPEVLEETSHHEACTIPQNDTSNSLSRRSSSFGKIAQLINENQKHVIETSYRVDMDVVDNEELMKHIILLDRKNIKCNICSASYIRLDKCKIHIMGHLNMKPYKCTMCDFATVTVTNVRTHIWKSHLKIKPFACDQCEKRFVNAVLLQEHLNTHTGARPFKCQNCDFVCASRQVLSSHNTIHKPNKDISCEICGKRFYSGARMRAHMQTHDKDKGVICSICKARLLNKMSLEMHVHNIHSRSYICTVCDKEFSCRKAWHNHQNVHTKAKYQCTLCPNVYKSRHILKEHLLKHRGIRKYKCTICKKSFGQQSHLAAHAATHSGVRFACPGCNRMFNRHDNMKTHTKRCRLFIEKPELANSIVRRPYTKSTNTPTKQDNKRTFLNTEDQ